MLLLEARLTLLERKVAYRLYGLQPSGVAGSDGSAEPLRISCDEPGLLIYHMYPIERDDQTGKEFCWFGGDGPIQFVLPVRPTRPLNCRLCITPHPRVDFSACSVMVNDAEPTRCAMTQRDELVELGFDVSPGGAPNLNIMLLGVTSVRPADLGENNDKRLLAARFYGAELTFL